MAEQADGCTRIRYNPPHFLEMRYGLEAGVAGKLAVIEQAAAGIAG